MQDSIRPHSPQRQAAGLRSSYALVTEADVSHPKKILYDRYAQLAGFIYRVPDSEHKTSRNKQRLNTHYHALTDVLKDAFAVTVTTLDTRLPGQFPPKIMLDLPVAQLLDPAMIKRISLGGQALSLRGITLEVAMQVSLAANKKKLNNTIMTAVYALKEAGVTLAIDLSEEADFLPTCRLKTHAETIILSPQNLGIPLDSSQFCTSLYAERVSHLNYLIHEQRHTVLLKDIRNRWQQEFINALPIAYFCT